MIIVSQDKNNAVNFDKVEILGIDEDNKKQIGCQFNDGNLILGKYATEERAKEVLQEIGERYEGWQNLVHGQPSGICCPRYEMPEK